MKTFKTIFITFSTILFFTYESALSDHSKKSFDKFKVDFANTKLKKNYSKELVDDFLLNTKFIKRVIELDRSQPEFKLTLKQYLNKVVTKTRIQKARKKFKANYKILKKIGDYYKVQPRFVVALWGIESDFGRIGGYFPVVSSISTLVYDGRRAKYFEKELFNSLKINSCCVIQCEDASVEFIRAIKNIPNSMILSQLGANVYDILKYKKLIITEAAVKKLEERLS